jgi:c-di-GMP-binding flagellar brake protein YcgR
VVVFIRRVAQTGEKPVGGEERRKYHRLKAEVKVEISYTDPDRDVTSLISDPVSQNVSAGGLLVRHSKHLAVGSDVVVKFILPSEKRYIMTFARVVRVDVVEEGKLYDIGICFVDPREDDVKRIDKYVTDSLDQP